MNLPDYNFLSAPLWLVTVLHILTLTLHFVAMNFLVGGIIFVLFGKIKDKWNDPTVKTFVKMFPNAMAATVTLGVAPLLFVQLTYHKYIYSASIVSGWFWLLIIVMAIIGYYFLYATSFSKAVSNKGTYLAIALLCFLYISFVYSSVFSMAERPDIYTALYAGNQSGWVLNPEIGSYIFRWLHMMLGAVTVGGFFVGWIGKNNEPAYNTGKQFFLWGMIAAIIFGFVYMMTFGDMMKPFMRSPGIWAVTLGLLLSLGSLHFFFKKKFVPAALMVFVSMLTMVYTRHVVRTLHFEGIFDPASIPFAPQWSIFILFLVCFVIALGLVWYMLKLFLAKE